MKTPTQARTQAPYSAHILACMERNLEHAKTPAMQAFCRERIAGYRALLSAKPRTFDNPMERFTLP